MLKKTVSYNNIDGDPTNKDVYFNISANELIEKEANSNQTYAAKLQEISKSSSLKEIYPVVLEFMADGYGVRTEDGDFEKDKTGAAWEKFKNTLAFQALMDELLIQDPQNNGSKLADFITGMLPSQLVDRVKEQQAIPGFRPGADVSRPTPPVVGAVAAEPSAPIGGVVPASEVSVQPVPVTPAEPVVSEPSTISEGAVGPESVFVPGDNWPETGPEATPDAGVIQQTSTPREPELPGQAPQQ